MTLSEAAQVLITSREQIRVLKAQEDAAATKLKEHFRKSKRAEYGRVRYAISSSMQLDTAAVKAFLGDKLPKFQKPVERETLSIAPEAA